MSVVYVYPKCPAGNSEGHWLSALHRFASVFSKPSILTLELTFFLLSSNLIWPTDLLPVPQHPNRPSRLRPRPSRSPSAHTHYHIPVPQALHAIYAQLVWINVQTAQAIHHRPPLLLLLAPPPPPSPPPSGAESLSPT
jgi:hypothetical protein